MHEDVPRVHPGYILMHPHASGHILMHRQSGYIRMHPHASVFAGYILMHLIFFFFYETQVQEAQEREGDVLGIEGDTNRHCAGGGGSVTTPPLEVYVTGSLLLCGDLMRLLEIESY